MAGILCRARRGAAVPAADAGQPGGYAGTFASVAGYLADGFGEKLREVQAPTVFVLGASSPMPVSQGQQTAALMPAAEVNVVPDAGHLPWHERPGCVAAALARVRERTVEGAP